MESLSSSSFKKSSQAEDVLRSLDQNKGEDHHVALATMVVWNKLALDVQTPNFSPFVIKTDVLISKQQAQEISKKFVRWTEDNRNALCTKVKILAIRGQQISRLPEELSKLVKMKQLDLTKNHFTTLPSSVCSLANLVDLFLRNNQLSTLLPEIERLKNLKWLDVSKNRFTAFPTVIGKLKTLIKLDFHKNQLTTVPSEIITALENLQELALFANPIKTLPPDIETVVKLKKLNLNKNHLASLPTPLVNRVNNCKIVTNENLGSQGHTSILALRVNTFSLLSSEPEGVGFDKVPLKCIVDGLIFWCEILKPLHLQTANAEVWKARCLGGFPSAETNTLLFLDYYSAIASNSQKKSLREFIDVLRAIKDFWKSGESQQLCILESNSNLKKNSDENKLFDKINIILTDIYQFLNKKATP